MKHAMQTNTDERRKVIGKMSAVKFASRLSARWMRCPLSPIAIGVLLCVASGDTTRAAVVNSTHINGGNCLVVLRHLMEKGYLSFEEPCYTLLPAGRDLICELLADCFMDNKQA